VMKGNSEARTSRLAGSNKKGSETIGKLHWEGQTGLVEVGKSTYSFVVGACHPAEPRMLVGCCFRYEVKCCLEGPEVNERLKVAEKRSGLKLWFHEGVKSAEVPVSTQRRFVKLRFWWGCPHARGAVCGQFGKAAVEHPELTAAIGVR
jgi:hypothetical protein